MAIFIIYIVVVRNPMGNIWILSFKFELDLDSEKSADFALFVFVWILIAKFHFRFGASIEVKLQEYKVIILEKLKKYNDNPPAVDGNTVEELNFVWKILKTTTRTSYNRGYRRYNGGYNNRG